MLLDSISRTKAYVIGMKGKYRNPNLLTSLNQLFDVVEFDGFVEPSRLEVDSIVDYQFYRATAYRDPMAEEVACFQAHLNAWRFLKNSDEDYLAVFEDDANLSVFQTEKILPYLGQLDGNWMLALERRFTDALISHLIPRKKMFRRMLLQPWGTAAYIISRSAATRALEVLDVEKYVDGPIDQSARVSSAFSFYQTLPPVAAPMETAQSLMPGKPKKATYSQRERIKRVTRILLSNNVSLGLKLGLLRIGWFRFVKYFFSIRFATTWFSLRYGEPAWVRDIRKVNLR